MKRSGAVLLALALALSACAGGGGDSRSAKPALPLPAKAPSGSGVATGPAMEPLVLLASTDDLETQASRDPVELGERRSGAFVVGDTVVGWASDNVSGYDLKTGEKSWTAKIDMEGGGVCFVSQPDRDVKRFAVVYGEGDRCEHVRSVRVSDGVAGARTDLYGPVDLDGAESFGGMAEFMVTVKGVDYIVDDRGLAWTVNESGYAEPLAQLPKSQRYTEFRATPDGSLLIASRYTRPGAPCVVDAFELGSFTRVWSASTKTVFPGLPSRDAECLGPLRANPLWLSASGGHPERAYLAQLDAKTGKVLGRAEAPMGDGHKRSGNGGFDLVDAYFSAVDAVGLPDGDIIFPLKNGVARHSFAHPENNWWQPFEPLLREGLTAGVGQQVVWSAVTDDGEYVVGTVTDPKDSEIVALKTSDGSVAGRWPLPDDYQNGFQAKPSLTLYDGGVVLTRNFYWWEFTFRKGVTEPPAGDRYDIGVFRFPAPDAS